MLLILGLLFNIYFSYLIIGFTSKNKKNVTFKSPFEILSRISSLIIIIALFWIFNIYNNFPSISKESGIEILLFDGLCKINTLILISEMFLLFLFLIMLQFIGINNKGKQTGPCELFLMFFSNLIALTYMFNSNDWVITITAWELMNLSLYLLVSMRGGGNKGDSFIMTADIALSAGIKYFLLSALTTAFLLMGVSLIYSKTGSTNYDILISFLNMFDFISYSNQNIFSNYTSFFIYNDITILFIGLLLISITLMFKLGAAPFHNWAPDLYDSLPTPITMFIALIPKIGLLFFMLTILPLIYHFFIPTFIGIFAIFSIIIGSIGLGSQWRIKRFITYSAISHLGFILLAYITLSLDSYLYYIFIYGISNLLFFSIILIINSSLDSEKQLKYNIPKKGNISSSFINNDGDITYLLTGLFKINPFLAFAFSITLFSLAGIPPLAGFFAKLQIIQGLLYNSYFFIALIVILTSAISTANYLYLIKISHLDLPIYNSFKIYVKPFNSYFISIFSTLLLFFFLKPSILLSLFTVILILFI